MNSQEKEKIALRKACADVIIRHINSLCKVVFNITEEKKVEALFCMSKEEMQDIMVKIVTALPAFLFMPANEKKLDEVKKILAREFIFFQVQERCTDPGYKEDLAHFIATFSRDIEKKMVAKE